MVFVSAFFFNDTATTEIYTLSLHDALPILIATGVVVPSSLSDTTYARVTLATRDAYPARLLQSRTTQHVIRNTHGGTRSEEHTSELQSRQYLVCRLLLEKKKPQANMRSPLV